MYWKDEGYLLFKNNIDENSIIIDTFTLNHGKYTGIVYGGSSKKQKKFFQIGNKILLNWKSKSENKIGYFATEIIKPVSPFYFDNKKRSICILAASSILKILLPDRQINQKIYHSFYKFINQLNLDNYIKLYILWELSLINELGFEINLKKNKFPLHVDDTIEINRRLVKIPKFFLYDNISAISNFEIREALIFNKNLLMENFIIPNNIKLPFSRYILEKYYN